MADVQRIRVLSVSTEEPFGDNKPGDFACVTFRVSMLEYNIDIPVYVNLGRNDETDIIRVARHEFASTLENALGLATGWKKEELVVKKREVALKEL